MTLSLRVLWGGRLLLCAAPLIVVGGVAELFNSSAGRPAVERFALASAVAVALAVWLWFWLRAIDAPTPGPAVVAVVALAVLGLVLTLHAGPGRDALLFAAAAAGAGLAHPRGLSVVAAIAALAGAAQLIDHATPAQAAGTAFNDLLVGLAAVGGRLLVLTNQELLAARGEVARLAVSEERLRFSRDLHDLIGQSLTFAVLTSELLVRDAPENAGARRAQLKQVADAVREALDDVRRAAAGYREPSLAGELATASERLASAGIQFQVSNEAGRVPVYQDAVLAWAVREGVANVLRHSAASSCRIRLRRTGSTVVMEMEDDGKGGRSPELRAQAGVGLAGIAERIAAAGGSSAAGPVAGGGFRVEVTLPVRS